MSYNHSTVGWHAYDSFVQGLSAAGIPYVEKETDKVYVRGSDIMCGSCHGYCNYDLATETFLDGRMCDCCKGTCEHRAHLRVATFADASGKEMAVEEYLAVRDHDCDGQDVISIAVYEAGKRPDLDSMTQVLEAG